MRAKKVGSQDVQVRLKPAETPEERENQMIGYAVDLAEKQLRDGTASSQVITHYLKLGTQREKLEREKLQLEKELLVARTEALQSQKSTEELYKKALQAMSIYSGNSTGDIDEDI